MIAALLLAQATVAAAAPAVDVTGADFRAEVTDEEGNAMSASTARVPLQEGVCYRWVLTVAPADRVVMLEERMTLPGPAEWGGVDGESESPTRLSADRRIATTPIFFSLKTGELSHAWCVDENDPEGAYTIDVSYDGRLLHSFRFTVGNAVKRRKG